VQYLRQSSFDVAANDAPFSIPEDHLPANGHQELLELVASMELSGTRPFPSAQALVDSALKGMSPIVKKSLRRTEHYWKQKGVNVRSTLWSGPRGGAAMTAACLKLLHQAHCPIWPWERNGPGLLVEAFPAAQLYQWGLPHQAYNRGTEKESAIRRSLVLSLAMRIELGAFRGIMEESADAFDAVVCAFAANAVAAGHSLWYAEEWLSVEGLIAVASREVAAESPSR
jgi:Protein of unknown function (DUF429)